MKILLTLDEAPSTVAALQAAARLWRGQSHTADLLCVVPAPPGLAQAAADAYRQRLREETAPLFAAAQTALRAEGFAAAPRLEYGSPAGVIARLSDEYDLTVVGARGKAASGSVPLGPVASRVVETASGAILIAREPAADRRLKILVGVDGSDATERALTLLAEGFDIRLAEVTLLHVMETPWVQFGVSPGLENFGGAGASATRWQQELEREAETLIENARNQLAASDVSIIPIIAEGNAATEMLNELESNAYDLVVVGASRQKDVKRQVLGSVSAKLVWYSPCSVLLVRA